MRLAGKIEKKVPFIVKQKENSKINVSIAFFLSVVQIIKI